MKNYRANIVLAIFLSLVFVTGSRVGVFRKLEWLIADQWFQLRKETEIDDRIVVVTIDEDDITNVNQWPMSDRDLSQIIKNIRAQQPRAIALDLYRDLPVPPGHDDLVKVFETTPNLIGVTKVAGNTIAPAPTLAEQGQTAANDLLVDADGKIRRVPVLLQNVDGSLIEGFGTKLALLFLEAEDINLEVENSDENIYQLGQARFVPLSEKDGDYLLEDMGGYQILLNYRGGLNSFLNISMTDVLENRIPDNLLTNKIVMIGPIAPSLNDIHQTSYNNSFFPDQKYMAGILIHANLTSQILAGALDSRQMLRLSTKTINYSLLVFCVVLSSGIGAFYVKSQHWSLIALFTTGAALILSAYVLFLQGWLIPVFTPLFALVSTATLSIIATLWSTLKKSYASLEIQHKKLEETYNQLSQITDSYSRFVPFDYLEFLKKEEIIDVKLGDHVDRQMAILFSDIRSFTPLTESMTPQQNFEFINAYLGQLSPEIRQHSGLIIKFLGDGLMAVFPEDPEDGLKSAIAQLQQLRLFNEKREKLAQKPIRIGFGLHFGKVMMGIVGEEFRMQGDILSDTVNLTSRLESLTKVYGISLLISETIFVELADPAQYKIRFLDRVVVKGRTQPISVYEVFDNDPIEAIAKKEATLTQYNQAIELYTQGKFAQARNLFKLIAEMNPLDTVSKVYLERLTTLENLYLNNGSAEKQWDGVWRFNEKF
ncbi:CHASE2 domain-containing protein [[Leptolyngbya] sp. PCC 7376]|uniref:CHASE2 domain-containing protein n=1 Tax=[Leptolyngbya] sp. PCC 7376 TaxID=111781 RepID=UPI001359F240|nr:adenylate/guanylate cyclase domain-containing protein [[Leptolyngbya] sp. PCC 7376]